MSNSGDFHTYQRGDRSAFQLLRTTRQRKYGLSANERSRKKSGTTTNKKENNMADNRGYDRYGSHYEHTNNQLRSFYGAERN